jgi:hypothetical protein
MSSVSQSWGLTNLVVLPIEAVQALVLHRLAWVSACKQHSLLHLKQICVGLHHVLRQTTTNPLACLTTRLTTTGSDMRSHTCECTLILGLAQSCWYLAKHTSITFKSVAENGSLVALKNFV